ncbi:hypothetical protein JOC54_002851 [Alkalihalobacillus xiaoxiensis]|uniref:Uncharacterized protein n=1 Tax=Shouchella xiaoxiensis TaxID=766895 RepID=A0ABS2SVM0_9BACI|nr:hypothetical protein [Shouchella xiaoxiensis]
MSEFLWGFIIAAILILIIYESVVFFQKNTEKLDGNRIV